MGRKGNGVELRANSIRVGFMFEGAWVRETLRIPPTPANEKYAAKLVAQVNDAIRYGRFTWTEFFPDSTRARREGPSDFSAAADLYLQSISRKTESTQDQYRLALERWKRILGANMPLKSMTHAFLKAKIGSHPWPSNKHLNNGLIPLRGVFELLYPGPEAMHNPMNGISNEPVVKKLPDPLTSEERDLVLQDIREHYDPRVVAYFTFAFFTGMRPEEIIALRWSDIDLRSGVARVQRVRTFRGREREGSKTHVMRDVDLVPQAIAALTSMQSYTRMRKVDRKGEDDTSSDVFENPATGEPWHDERSQRRSYWQPTLRRLKIRRRRAYATRHTYATTALMGGVPPAYIAAQLGHSVQMLLTYYARWISGADKGSAKSQLAAVMGGDTSPQFPAAVLLNTK